MKWAYLIDDTMNAAGKQSEIFAVLNKTWRKLKLVDHIHLIQG